jgi:hypothetical protein
MSYLSDTNQNQRVFVDVLGVEYRRLSFSGIWFEIRQLHARCPLKVCSLLEVVLVWHQGWSPGSIIAVLGGNVSSDGTRFVENESIVILS